MDNIESIHKKEADLIIETQSGTYIKELITGDNGKTKPNISELIENHCTVKKLDVIKIKEWIKWLKDQKDWEVKVDIS